MDPIALNELYVAALCIWREMRGGTPAERIGCYWVLKNRQADGAHRWPRSLAAVATQPFQFSSFLPGDPNARRWPTPDGSLDWQAFIDIVTMIGSGAVDPTSGANHYENMPGTTRPTWADPGKLTTVLGITRFYRL